MTIPEAIDSLTEIGEDFYRRNSYRKASHICLAIRIFPLSGSESKWPTGIEDNRSWMPLSYLTGRRHQMTPLPLDTGTAWGVTGTSWAEVRGRRLFFFLKSYLPDNSIFRMQIRPDHRLYCLSLTNLAQF